MPRERLQGVVRELKVRSGLLIELEQHEDGVLNGRCEDVLKEMSAARNYDEGKEDIM